MTLAAGYDVVPSGVEGKVTDDGGPEIGAKLETGVERVGSATEMEIEVSEISDEESMSGTTVSVTSARRRTAGARETD